MDTQLTAPNAQTALLTFNPPADAISDILERLGDPDILLSDSAEKYHTTLEALTLWMATDDIIARMADLQSAIAARVRFIATAALPKAAEALGHIIGEYNHEAQHVPLNPNSLPARAQRLRSREIARTASALLHRLTNFGRDLGLRPRFRSPRLKVLLPKTPELPADPTSLPAPQSPIQNPKSEIFPDRRTQLLPPSPTLPISTSENDPLAHRNGHETLNQHPP